MEAGHMSRLQSLIIWLGLPVLLLAACQPAPAAQITATPPATANSETHTAAPASPTPPSAATITPTLTPDPSTPAESTATPKLAAPDIYEWVSDSPDGQWRAEGLTIFPRDGSDEYYTRLTVARVGGPEAWTVVDGWQPTGLGWTSPAPLRWAADGRAFYFTNLPHPDGCAMLVNGSDLLRLDLLTGEVEELLPSISLWLALSPDEGRVAYVAYGERGLVIRDLATGAEQDIALGLGRGFNQAGGIVWSPDGSRLALTIAHEPCSESWTHSIVVVDLDTGRLTTLLDKDPRQYVSEAWLEADRLRLSGPEGEITLDVSGAGG
jgi:hypothetical protein